MKFVPVCHLMFLFSDDYAQQPQQQQPEFSYEAFLQVEAGGPPPEEVQDNVLLNGDTEEVPTIRPCDIIRITGKAENCEAAKEALLNNVPITVEVKTNTKHTSTWAYFI